jgi:glycosyltransferase involved in cell wall biosynthesis
VHLDTGRDWRGGQSQVLLLLRGLAARGHAVLLLAPPAPLLERARAAGLEARAWGARGEWDLPSAFAAARAARDFGADLLHAHTARAHALGWSAARVARRPLVVSRRVALAPGRDPFSRLKYRAAARYLCVSRGVIEAMRRSGIPDRRMALVPSGIDLDAGAPASDDLRRLIAAAPDDPVVGTVAALTAEKQHDVLLEAAAAVTRAVPRARFVWIGEGERREALERMRARLGLERTVHLLGFRDDARGLLAQCTVMALASSHEGIGNAVLEAQWLGVPVVATAVGGVPEIVSDRNTGRLVPPGDPKALATALIETLSDPEGRASWIEPARRVAREHGSERMIERTIEQYRLVVDQTPAPGGAESTAGDD